MTTRRKYVRFALLAIGMCGLIGIGIMLCTAAPSAVAGPPRPGLGHRKDCCPEPVPDEFGGTWYWLRSPEEEQRVVIARFNRYCIRCHGVDGRGVWDIPDVPNFTNPRWQAFRTDGQLARAILEGRGSVMPPWRGVLSLEEAWALARYVRTFVPGDEISRPDFDAPEKPGPKEILPAPKPGPTPPAPAKPASFVLPPRPVNTNPWTNSPYHQVPVP